MKEEMIFTVKGMTCPACEMKIERTLAETPGVTEAKVSLASGVAKVSFDGEKTGAEELIKSSIPSAIPPL